MVELSRILACERSGVRGQHPCFRKLAVSVITGVIERSGASLIMPGRFCLSWISEHPAAYS
jgi:hypothetical protein